MYTNIDISFILQTTKYMQVHVNLMITKYN